MNELVVHSGRVCCRVVSGHNDVVVGLLHMDPAASVQEGAEYLLVLEPNRLRLLDLGKGYSDLPNGGLTMEQMSEGLCSLVLSSIWHGTALPQTRTVRLVKQFDDSNGWLVVGPKQGSAFKGDQWWDVLNNHLTPLAPPGDFVGHALKGLLAEPLWPHPNGQCHTLTDVFQPFRPIYRSYHMLLVNAARAPVYKDIQKDIVSLTPHMPLIATTMDREYANFLSVVDAARQLTPPGPQSIAQTQKQKEVADRAIGQLETPTFGAPDPTTQATLEVLEALKRLHNDPTSPDSSEWKEHACDKNKWSHISDWLHVAPLAIKTQTLELVEHIADVFLNPHPDHLPPQLPLMFDCAVRWNAPKAAVALHEKMSKRERERAIPKNSETRLLEMLNAGMTDEVLALRAGWGANTAALVTDRVFYTNSVPWNKKAHILQNLDSATVKHSLRTRYVFAPTPRTEEFDAFCTQLGLSPTFNLVHERSALRDTITQVKQLRADRRQKQKLEKTVGRCGVQTRPKKM